jgi:DNA-binding XRE family transcriptional regulator
VKHNKAVHLKRLRERKGLNQEQMAALLGYTLFGYRKIEQGSRGLPIHKALEAKAILGCSLEDIFLP